MAPTASNSSPETRQAQFEQGVAISLHLWTSLTIAVQNQWGGPDSADKRDWLAGVIVDMFPSFVDLAAPVTNPSTSTTAAAPSSSSSSKPKNQPQLPEEPLADDIEETLLQVLFDEFEVNVDDQSGAEVADRIMKCRSQCSTGDFSLVEELRSKWVEGKGKKVVMKESAAPDQETDEEESGSDEDEDGDVDMADAEVPELVRAREPRNKELVVDEDGFTLVSKKK
ncbi:Pre-rRNA-processing protein TSR2-domain-containing protein [Xylariaceae sp. FL0255]|nr:Pre-rRNA-processing protein TSR2-domain-containing protein [Xylariaceae sp. FL0255]